MALTLSSKRTSTHTTCPWAEKERIGVGWWPICALLLLPRKYLSSPAPLHPYPRKSPAHASPLTWSQSKNTILASGCERRRLYPSCGLRGPQGRRSIYQPCCSWRPLGLLHVSALGATRGCGEEQILSGSQSRHPKRACLESWLKPQNPVEWRDLSYPY